MQIFFPETAIMCTIKLRDRTLDTYYARCADKISSMIEGPTSTNLEVLYYVVVDCLSTCRSAWFHEAAGHCVFYALANEKTVRQ